jgi:RHS repeat-associated protein
MASPRQLGRRHLARFSARVTIAALLFALLPLPSEASIAPRPDRRPVESLAVAATTATTCVVLVVVVVVDPSRLPRTGFDELLSHTGSDQHGDAVRGDDLHSGVHATETRFYLSDGTGSIRRLTDEAGDITDGYTYTAFGELLSHTGSDPQPYAFTGEPLDPNSGFQYHRARWMDPRVGRFTSMDPFEGFAFDPPSLHRYTYVRNEPTSRVDPSGREDVSLVSFSIAVGISATLNAISSYRMDASLYGAAAGFLQGAFIGAAFFAGGAAAGVGLLRAAPLLVRISKYSGPVLGTLARILGVLPKAPVPVAAPATTILWRAVEESELNDVLAFGDYGTSPSMAGKYFALTEEGARNFANAAINAGKRMTITSIEVPTSFVERFAQAVSDPGGAGASIFFAEEILPRLYAATGLPAIVDAPWIAALR